MYEMLKNLYSKGKVNEEHLNNAVLKGWITEAEKKEIMV
ncbi:XkdX family protein [Helicovermis profundi]